MSIKIEVKMSVKIMYNFLLQHTYTSLNGIIGTIFGIVCMFVGGRSLGRGFSQPALILVLMGILFVFINPLLLWNRARKQVKKTPMFKKPISYELTESGITISQEDEADNVAWDSIRKVVETNMSIIVYFTRMRAFILPKEAMGEEYGEVVKMIYTHVDNSRVKIKSVNY